MSEKQTFRLAHARARELALAAVRAAPDLFVVEVKPPTRNLDQNAALHGCLTDIAEQLPWRGQSLTVDVWKRLCMAAWLREEGQSPEMIPALDGQGFDVIFERSSHLTVRQMSSLLEWVKAFAAQNGVTLKDEAGR